MLNERTDSPEISVVVPFYNEAENVLPLATKIFEALIPQTTRFEMLLVDDGSKDETWARILEMQRKDARVRPIRHLRNSGQSAALWTGFMQSRGEIIATLDGDLQNDPADFPNMLKELADCDMVCGARTRRADNTLRRLSSGIARSVRKWALRSEFNDTGCNLRVFRRWLLQNLAPFDGLHRFMPILAQNAGGRVKEISVLHHPRAAGMSKYGVWNRLGRGIRDLVMVRLYLKRQLRRVPLEIPTNKK